jgi:DNA polymerase V
MSARVMQVLRDFTLDVEVYSIHESFLRIERLRQLWRSWEALGRAVRRQVRQWTGISPCAWASAPPRPWPSFTCKLNLYSDYV